MSKKPHKEERVKIARRVAEEFEEGDIINLGVGIPTMIPDFLGGKEVYLHSENGLLGIGPTPPEEEVDMDLISASKQPITMNPGASLFSSSDSFAMIRGAHIDAAVLGALQVDETGRLANWAVPGKSILGVGGAMDLVAGAKKIILSLTHQSKDGTAKLVSELTYPNSGLRRADMVVTEKAVFRFVEKKMYLVEMAENMTVEKLREITDGHFEVSSDVKTMK